MTLSDRIAELEQYIIDIKFKLSISPDHPIGSQLPGAEAELAELQSRAAHPTNMERTTMQDTRTVDTFDTLISVTEAAARLNVTSQTIRNWVRAGRLTRIQTGKTFRIDPAELVGLEAMRRETRIVESVETRGI